LPIGEDSSVADWYYVENDAQQGPVNEPRLDALMESGAIAGDTLVWCEGMADWMPYSQAMALRAAPPPPASPVVPRAVSPYARVMLAYGAFGTRAGAKLIDIVILSFVNGVFGALGVIVAVFVSGAYHTFFVGKYGATPGKLAVGLRIVKSNGEPVGYPLALGRYFAEWLSWLTLLVGYFMAAFDAEKRTLHDRICDTRVIYKR